MKIVFSMHIIFKSNKIDKFVSAILNVHGNW